MRQRGALGLLLALVLLLPAIHRADDDEKAKDKKDAPSSSEAKDAPPPLGTWKVFLPTLRDAGPDPVWLVRFEKKGDAWSGEVLANRGAGTRNPWPAAKLGKLQVSADQARFELKADELTLACTVNLPKQLKGAKLRGTFLLNRRAQPFEMERTALKSLDAATLEKEKLAQTEDGFDAVMLALPLLARAESRKASSAEVRAWAEKAVRSAGLYGPAWQRDILLVVAEVLAQQKGMEATALQYARRAERLLTPKDPVGVQKSVLEALAEVLTRAGKEEDAKLVQARIKKLDFRVKVKPYAGRKGKGSRVVLVELFTNTGCPPCVAADLAYDAVGKTYKPSEVVLLQYHLNQPAPDPLTNAASEARAEFYDKVIEGMPTVLLNGKAGPEGGGAIDDAPEKYEEYTKALEPLLEAKEKAELKLTASQKGSAVTINAEVANLAETGDDVRLRLVLVEQQVSYKAANGITVHHHVVRDMPGGDAGTVMKGKSGKKTVTVDVDEVRKKLKAFADKMEAKKVPLDKVRPMELKQLRVIAFVQNDKTGEVLQAAQADVKAESEK